MHYDALENAVARIKEQIKPPKRLACTISVFREPGESMEEFEAKKQQRVEDFWNANIEFSREHDDLLVFCVRYRDPGDEEFDEMVIVHDT